MPRNQIESIGGGGAAAAQAAPHTQAAIWMREDGRARQCTPTPWFGAISGWSARCDGTDVQLVLALAASPAMTSPAPVAWGARSVEVRACSPLRFRSRCCPLASGAIGNCLATPRRWAVGPVYAATCDEPLKRSQDLPIAWPPCTTAVPPSNWGLCSTEAARGSRVAEL